MEAFFCDDRLVKLFKLYADKIKSGGYKQCENHRNNRHYRNDCTSKMNDLSINS